MTKQQMSFKCVSTPSRELSCPQGCASFLCSRRMPSCSRTGLAGRRHTHASRKFRIPGRSDVYLQARINLSCGASAAAAGIRAANRSSQRAHKARTANLRCCAQAEPATELAGWSDFCRAASGEWEGSSATFSSDGSPQELPPNYVPDAYREWGMQLYDWQTQCSTLAEESRLLRKLKRLMPTVGCEADAVAFTEEEQTTEMTTESDSGDSCGPQFWSDGCYTIPADFGSGSRTQAEHCFVLGEGERIRMVHAFHNLASGWVLSGVELHRERREGAYNGGKELAGCGGGMPSFAEKERLSEADLQGDWAAKNGSSNGAEASSTQQWNPEETLRLPLNTWSRCSMQEGEIKLESGCTLSQNQRLLASHVYKAGSLVRISLVSEQRS